MRAFERFYKEYKLVLDEYQSVAEAFICQNIKFKKDYMWCCGIVTRVKRRDDKMIKVDIRWEEYFIAFGESYLTEDILKKHLWNLEKRKKYTWMQNVQRYLTTIEKY